MPRYVALLRAVNVGGSAVVPMAALRATFTAAGCERVGTVLQSGSVTFTSSETSSASLESRLETSCHDRLGLTTVVMVRSDRAWRRLLEGNPFPAEAKSDPAHLLVGVPKRAVARAAWQRFLERRPAGRERVALGDGAIYLVYPDGIGRSKLTTARIEGPLDTPITCRNWTTLERIDRQLAEDGA